MHDHPHNHDRSNQRNLGDRVLVVPDSRFWPRSIGSEQRVAAGVQRLAARKAGVVVAYVGRVKANGRAALAALQEATESPSIYRLGFRGGRDSSIRDSLDCFETRAWPDLRSEIGSQVELHVAGQVCDSWDRTELSVHALGPIESIDPFWRLIHIAINPVRSGSGLGIKNVEALAYGLPLLTTKVGAAGLEYAAPAGLRIEGSSEAWHTMLKEWLNDAQNAIVTGQARREYAQTYLSEQAAFAERDAFLRGAREGESDP